MTGTGDASRTGASAPDHRDFWNEWNARWRAGLEGEWQPDEASRRRHETILAWLRQLPLQQPEILEVGCGAGWLSEQLRAFGPVTAVDLADAVVARARSRFPLVHFVAGDFYDVPLPARHYDVLVSIDLLSCVPDQERLVLRLAERLKPGGYLALATPNRFVWERQENQDARATAPIRHWHTRRELRALVGPWFRVLRLTTVAPAGHRGVLRIVNSYKLETMLSRFVAPAHLTRARERLGFGRSLVMLARRRG